MIFCAEAVQAKLGTLSLEAQSKLEKETAKKEAKADAKADAALKKKLVRVSILLLLTPTLTSCRHHKLVFSEFRPPRNLILATCLGDYLPYRAEQAEVRYCYLRSRGLWYAPYCCRVVPFTDLYPSPGIDLKKASKQFSSKFATGSSVTKNVQNQDEIVVQGDVSDEIVEMISQGVGVLKGIPAENVEVVTVGKKKDP
jgi:translation initiation factor 1 (eIF-1/SUI1)